ncbi:HTH domain-containing protein [bacterium]|nr:MAG: HTH domain-containing protein [bacterium]
MKDRGERATPTELERYRVGSLSKGLRILALLCSSERAMSLSELAERLGWNRTTAYRFMATLQADGYVDQDPVTKTYALTARVMDLGFSYLNALSFPERSLPYLNRLSAVTGHSCNLSVLDGAEIVYVARVASRSLLSINLHVGSRLPAYCTSMGKVLLAWLPPRELRSVLAGLRIEARTAKTVRNAEELLRLLGTTRRNGYAVNDQELEIGVRSAAAPIRDGKQRVIAALNVSVPAAHCTLSQLMRDVVPRVLEAARDISTAIGQRTPERLHR